ncbi:L-2-hydroxyglutarate oxidase LhgO [Amorphus suaedae]
MLALVIGGGVVGLAVARALALRGHEVLVAEATGGIGNGISSRNSEVVHGGMYYPEGSLKAVHCVRGRSLLKAYCGERRLPYAQPGKLIVASGSADVQRLRDLQELGTRNGVEGLRLLSGAEARAMEPELAGEAALWSPETGILDTHALMLSFLGDIEDAGGAIAFQTSVERLEPDPAGGWRVHLAGEADGPLAFDAVVNAAGLGAMALAGATEGYPHERVPELRYAKGNYFAYPGRPVFSRLIYPVPVDGGLGIHLTLDLAGRMRFGPDVEWVDRPGYDVDPTRAESFYASIRQYWPRLPDGGLVPDYAGVRPKLTGPGGGFTDFLIDGPADHGMAGLVHLFGIESPGITSSMSLAEDVAVRIEVA